MANLPPVAGAKIQLMKWIESSGSSEAMLCADELLEARTLRELAERAREIALRIQEVDGGRLADCFWQAAKRILVQNRDLGSAQS
jgi:hypothetical protein